MELGPLTKQKQEELEQKPMHVETLREHLTSLQNWDTGVNASVEEQHAARRTAMLRREEAGINASLQRHMQEQAPPIQAQGTAAGNPVQETAPAKLNWKQKRQQKKQDEEAKRITGNHPGADHITYHMHQDMKWQETVQLNSLLPYRDQAVEADVDLRVLRWNLTGYNKNKKGQPATENDRLAKEQDERFLEDYISKDVERRRPHLDRITKQLIELEITEEMFTPAYLEHHSAEMKEIVNRMTYYQNIYDDEINKPYFDALPQLQKDLIETRIFGCYAQISDAFVTTAFLKGYKANSTKYQAPEEIDNYGIQLERKDEVQASLRQALRDRKEQAQKAVEDELKRRMEAQTAELLEEENERRELIRTNEAMSREYGDLGFTGYTAGQIMDNQAKYRNMIEARPDVYAQSHEAIDKVFQEMYRCSDALSELELEMAQLQKTRDERSVAGGSSFSMVTREDPASITYFGDEALRILLNERLSAKEDERTRLLVHLRRYNDAIGFYMGKNPLSEAAENLLKDMGLAEDAKILEGKRKVEKLFQGEGGIIDSANMELAEAKRNAEQLSDPGTFATIEEAREDLIRKGEARALTVLGLRTSGREGTKADNQVRGRAYETMKGDYADYFHEQEEAGIALSGVYDAAKKVRIGKRASAVTGGAQMVRMTGECMERAQNILLGDKSINYIRYMSDILKDVEVFGHNQRKIVSYLVLCVLNNNCMNGEVFNHKDSYQDGDAALTVSKEVSRNILAIAGLDTDDAELVPEEFQQAYALHQSVIDRVMNRLSGAA